MRSDYLSPLVRLYKENANPEKAEAMSKYMLYQYEYYGIQTPRRKELYKIFFAEAGLPEIDDVPVVVKALWGMPQREYHYFALVLLDKFIKKAPEEWIELYESLILQKSWWDTVDYIAPQAVGTHYRLYPDLVSEYTSRWIKSDNKWLQRSCLLYQLKYKQDTNTDILQGFILQLNHSKEFFIRKAIGWILREYSKTNPEWVENFINNHELSPLSIREGMKWINKSRKFS
jgi:3-methyladenine DNA glycosylase AlkD